MERFEYPLDFIILSVHQIEDMEKFSLFLYI